MPRNPRHSRQAPPPKPVPPPTNNLVGVIMGSQSDWETLIHTSQTLDALSIPHEVRVVSAHRTPDLLFEYASLARGRGLRVIIAGAGGAAHLPGMAAAKTSLPVLGVPIESKSLQGLDSLLSIVQMPAGIPVATLAIGKAGAINAAILAASILAPEHPSILESLDRYRAEQTRKVLTQSDPRAASAPSTPADSRPSLTTARDAAAKRDNNSDRANPGSTSGGARAR